MCLLAEEIVFECEAREWIVVENSKEEDKASGKGGSLGVGLGRREEKDLL